VLLVAETYDDGWLRGIRLRDLEIGFFPKDYVTEDMSPIYKLSEIPVRSMDDYRNDPRFTENDSSRRSKIALVWECVYIILLIKLIRKFTHQN
jgi:hypothetical protein